MIFKVLKKDLFLVMGICCVSVWGCGGVHVTERRYLLKPEANLKKFEGSKLVYFEEQWVPC